MKRILKIIAGIIGIVALCVICFVVFNPGVYFTYTVLYLPVVIGVTFVITCITFRIKKDIKETTKIKALLILNIAGFLTFTAMYFFVFDLQWGIDSSAFTWGLTLLAGIFLLVIGAIVMLKQKLIKPGILGFSVGFITVLYSFILVNYFSTVFFPIPRNTPEVTQNTQENEILQLILNTKPADTTHIIIIYPITDNLRATAINSKEVENLVEQAMATIGKDDIIAKKIPQMIYKHIQINQKPVPLTIKASVKDGYYIDYDRVVSRYFNDGGGGWQRLRGLRPCMGSFVTVTYPSYDSETGIGVISIGSQADYLSGGGSVYVFRYTNGHLQILASRQTWIS